jgi:hypothetical protein
MSEISAIASSAMVINQSQLQVQISESMLRMNAQADQAMVAMLLQNTRQIQVLSNAASGHIDLFV